jgi:hypothetical protein
MVVFQELCVLRPSHLLAKRMGKQRRSRGIQVLMSKLGTTGKGDLQTTLCIIEKKQDT